MDDTTTPRPAGGPRDVRTASGTTVLRTADGATVRLRLLTRLVPGGGPDGPHGADLPVPGRTGLPVPGGTGREDRPGTSPVTTRPRGGQLDVVLRGDVDLLLRAELAGLVEEAVRHCRAHRRARVRVDVSAVSAVDSTAVRVLEDLRRRTADAGGTCTVTGARPAVARVLELAAALPTGEPAAS